jgi:hypothetical protein
MLLHSSKCGPRAKPRGRMITKPVKLPILLKRVNFTTANPIFSLRGCPGDRPGIAPLTRGASAPRSVPYTKTLEASAEMPHVDMSTAVALAYYAVGRVGLGWLRAISPRQETATTCRDQRAS